MLNSFITAGGVLLFPILGLSLVAVFIIIDRSLYYWKIREVDKELSNSVVSVLRRISVKQLFSELQNKKSPESRVIIAGLRGGKRLNEPENRKRIDYIALKEISLMERFVPHLQNIANVATLIGLLGTVLGMIDSFLNMRSSGSTDITALAGGISQALITTAAGLSVAIPSSLFYHIFLFHIQKTTKRLNILTSEMIVYFVGVK